MKTPAVILVNPQMGENIGAAARAMFNFGLTDLRLVAPRDGWPSDKATAMSSGTLERMPPVRVFDTLAEAIADCHFVLATTARPRELVKPVFTARGAAGELQARQREGQATALLFGAERSGLETEDVALAHGIITIPANPDFTSINLAQAVLLVAYEWYQAGQDVAGREVYMGDSFPASHDHMTELFGRLEATLEEYYFFRSPDMKPAIMRNLKSMLLRAGMTDQEVKTFHGILSAFQGKKAPPGQY